jgi:hypothetical protein
MCARAFIVMADGLKASIDGHFKAMAYTMKKQASDMIRRNHIFKILLKFWLNKVH